MAIDARAVRRLHLHRKATGPDVLAREVAARMDARLDYIRVDPALIVDAGCGRGDDLASLATRYPRARVVGLDASALIPVSPITLRRGVADRVRGLAGDLAQRLGFVRRARAGRWTVQADFDRLPLADSSVDLLWSNLALAWSSDPMTTFAEWKRVLAQGGLLMFSTWGPDTVRELREAFESIGERTRVHPFIDMHDLGDMLSGAGFADPVIDMERITLTYADVLGMVSDLRAGAQTNARLDRPRGLLGPRRWQQVLAAMEQGRHQGRLSLTFEVVQGHAWKLGPAARSDGRSVVQFRPRPSAGRPGSALSGHAFFGASKDPGRCTPVLP